MRRAIALAGAVVALAGCGDGEGEPGGASPRETLELFATAVNEDDSGADELVSRRLDDAQRESFVQAVRKDVEPLQEHRIIFDERLSDDVAVVAAQGVNHPRPGAYAAMVVHSGETWFVEPNSLDLIYGASALSGTRASKPEVDFQVNAPAGAKVQARMWIDGNEVRLRREGERRYVAGIRRLRPGLYTVVAYAKAGDRTGAIAWAFRVA